MAQACASTIEGASDNQRNADAVDSVRDIVSTLQKRFYPHTDAVWRVLRFHHWKGDWEAAATTFLSWRASEARTDRLRFYDDPFGRRTLPYILGAEALIHTHHVDAAIHALEEAQAEVQDIRIEHLLTLARAKL
jgi:hypothetical protein